MGEFPAVSGLCGKVLVVEGCRISPEIASLC